MEVVQQVEEKSTSDIHFASKVEEVASSMVSLKEIAKQETFQPDVIKPMPEAPPKKTEV